MSCGDFRWFMYNVKKLYKRRYVATYSIEDEKYLRLAYESYLYGVLNYVGIVRATEEIAEREGFSPPRMANFLRELQLWNTEYDTWNLWICQVTMAGKYTRLLKTGEPRTEEINITLRIPYPISYAVRPYDESDYEAIDFVVSGVDDDLMVRYPGKTVSVYELLTSMSYRVEHEPEDSPPQPMCKDITRLPRDRCVLYIDYEMVWSKPEHRKTYNYSGEFAVLYDEARRYLWG